MSTKTTYVLSKEEIVSKLENLHFSFEEHYWESFQQQFDEVRTHQAPASTAKFSPKLIAIPACIVLVGIIIYFSVNKAQSQNNAAGTKVNVETASTAPSTQVPETKKPVAKTETVPDAQTSTPATTVANNAVTTPQQTTAKTIQPNAANVTAPLNQANSASTVPSNTAKVAGYQPGQTQGTVTQPQQQPVKRFYKKKTDTQTVPQQLVPSPGEDDVVVPAGESGNTTPEN
jgi:hypothetical protein